MVARALRDMIATVLTIGLLVVAFDRLDAFAFSAAEAATRADIAAMAEDAVAHAADPIGASIRSVWGPLADEATKVAFCESSLRPANVSDDQQDWGLFQINVVHEPLVRAMGYEWDDLLDPTINTIVAKEVFDRAGSWSPWTCAWAASAR
jgi:hypothetical protein